MRKSIFTLVILSVIVLNAQFLSRVDFNGTLYRSAISGNDLKTSEIITDSLPDNIKKEVSTFLNRYGKFHSLLEDDKETKDEFIHKSIFEKKTAIERGIFSTHTIPMIDSLAADFARKFPVMYVWEGYSEGPLSEANYIKNYISDHKDTSIKQYLQILLLHRLKCLSETLLFEKKSNEFDIILLEYKALLHQIYEGSTLIFKLIAEDIDKQKYLYLENK